MLSVVKPGYTKSKLPRNISLAVKFLWEVMLTPDWDHLFKEMPIPPHKNVGGFCPNEIDWGNDSQLEGDSKLVEFREIGFGSSRTYSTVVVGMRPEKIDKLISWWYPNSIQGNIRVFSKDLIKLVGSDTLVIPPTRVWFKD